MTSETKAQIAAKNKFRADVLELVRNGVNERLKMEAALGLTGISGRLSMMVKTGLLKSRLSGRYDHNRTQIVVYELGDGYTGYKWLAAKKPEPIPVLYQIWPSEIPETANPPRTIKLTNERHNGSGLSCKRGIGICSSMGD